MTEELRELRDFVVAKTERLHALDRQLFPVWQRENAIKHAIKVTHDCMDDVTAALSGRPLHPVRSDIHVVGLRFEQHRREQRFGLVAELDRLTEQWGPVRKARRELKLEIDAAVRAINRITEAEAKAAEQAAKQPKKPPGTLL